MLIELPQIILGCCIFDAIVLSLVGLDVPLFPFYAVTIIASALGFVQAQLCAWYAKDPLSGFVLFAFLASYEVPLSGYLIARRNIPDWWLWAVPTTFTKWIIQFLVFIEFHNYKGIQGEEVVLRFYGYKYFVQEKAYAVLISYLVLMQCLMLYTMFPAKSK